MSEASYQRDEESIGLLTPRLEQEIPSRPPSYRKFLAIGALVTLTVFGVTAFSQRKSSLKSANLGSIYTNNANRYGILCPGDKIDQPGACLGFKEELLSSPNGQKLFVLTNCAGIGTELSSWGRFDYLWSFDFLTMQDDGNVVLNQYWNGFLGLGKRESKVRWASGTSGQNLLIINNDASVQILDRNNRIVGQMAPGYPDRGPNVVNPAQYCFPSPPTLKPTPSPTTPLFGQVSKGQTYLCQNQYLSPDQSIYSADGKVQLTVQGDGNVVVYSGGKPLWNTGTSGRDVGYLILQSDGHLILKNKGNGGAWESGQYSNKEGFILVVQNDGNIVEYDRDGKVFWATGSAVVRSTNADNSAAFAACFTPTAAPTSAPIAPTPKPSALPSAEPTPIPTPKPSPVPSALPTFVPTPLPSAKPTVAPTDKPTPVPTSLPAFYSPFWKKTNPYSYGDSVYTLDNHDVDCVNEPITSFHLYRPNNKDIAYEYTCGQVNPSLVLVDIKADMSPEYQDGGGKNELIYLDRQNLRCPLGYFITRFIAQTKTRFIRINYACKSYNTYVSEDMCNWKNTGNQDMGSQELFYLDRHTVTCDTGKALRAYKYARGPGNTMTMIYQCCSANVLYPSALPTPVPISDPTAKPISDPTEKPTFAPTADPSSQPVATPTGYPFANPTATPISDPTAIPISDPTVSPIADPTFAPIADPTAAPVSEKNEGIKGDFNKPTDSPVTNPTLAPVEIYTDPLFCPFDTELSKLVRTPVPSGCVLISKHDIYKSLPYTTTPGVYVCTTETHGKLKLDIDDFKKFGIASGSSSFISIINPGDLVNVKVFEVRTGESFIFDQYHHKALTEFNFKDRHLANDKVDSLIIMSKAFVIPSKCDFLKKMGKK